MMGYFLLGGVNLGGQHLAVLHLVGDGDLLTHLELVEPDFAPELERIA